MHLLIKNHVVIPTPKCLELIHINLFGPIRTESLGGNYYALVVKMITQIHIRL